MSKSFRCHSRVGHLLCGSTRMLVSSLAITRCHLTYRETLESNARSSAASPCTTSPLFSLSISRPPSYRPISIEGWVAPGAGDGCVVAWRRFEGWDGLVFGNGLGAANLVSNLATFVWLGCFECVGLVVEDDEATGAGFFPVISRAAICRVTDPMDVMFERTRRCNQPWEGMVVEIFA